MFIAQLLKLLFFAAFVYVLVTLFRFILRVGRLADEKRKRENIREEGPGPRKRDGVIEIDKDHYKVE
jgi:hypothetical protein